MTDHSFPLADRRQEWPYRFTNLSFAFSKRYLVKKQLSKLGHGHVWLVTRRNPALDGVSVGGIA
jgi:hypothetical protein